MKTTQLYLFSQHLDYLHVLKFNKKGNSLIFYFQIYGLVIKSILGKPFDMLFNLNYSSKRPAPSCEISNQILKELISLNSLTKINLKSGS